MAHQLEGHANLTWVMTEFVARALAMAAQPSGPNAFEPILQQKNHRNSMSVSGSTEKNTRSDDARQNLERFVAFECSAKCSPSIRADVVCHNPAGGDGCEVGI